MKNQNHCNYECKFGNALKLKKKTPPIKFSVVYALHEDNCAIPTNLSVENAFVYKIICKL